MENQLMFNFEGESVRTVVKDNQTYFVGNEVAKILGYSNYRNAINNHAEDEDKLRTQIRYAGQLRNVTLINESGLYSLIFSSKLE
ncbi:anti-repressor [Staphylococcus phage vB_SauM_Remus]|uniref:Phage anti-repressor protein n=5 Tax=Silviavirus remus TaxID=1857890 RepID=S4T8Y5_9CAUD|nr:phage anti-repressor protein [Staphylococcus phage vB_SauM_Romulus]YP_008431301.1 anti-repressor [Staphylococcus phage vB_SauM_Remus]QVD57680.1 anti-repressor protein [Staphylococcus phage PM56]QVD58573.1 anti-repressor protein [Staphylococcus phage PM93]QVD58776.1 anti-repressor protein [Silviavirus remus]QVD58967.1 anti-repressor protein [Staphylococcus phage Romulus]AFV81061.1 phage anti-repressor protein [Staphylococcus phage vB_SauM_Remus]